jgi:hypothetical protein
MEIKKINPNALPVEYKEFYDEIKRETKNFRKDYLEILDEDGDITDFVDMVKESYPEAIKVDKPSSSPTLSGKPKNVTQLKKWLKANVGKKIYVKNHPKKEFVGEDRVIKSVKTTKLETERPGGKTSFLNIPAAKDIDISDVGFTFNSNITFVYDKKDAKPKPKPKKEYSEKVKKKLDYLKKKYPDLKSQIKGRKPAEVSRDLERKGKKPGKRKSASGNVYYENRPNRSDKRPQQRLKHGGQATGNDPQAYDRVRIADDLNTVMIADCVNWYVIAKNIPGTLEQIAELVIEVHDQVSDGYVDSEVKDMAREAIDLIEAVEDTTGEKLGGSRKIKNLMREVIALKDTMKTGGRLKSALMRDRKYVSDQEWEESYHAKRGKKDTRTGYKNKSK